MLLSMRQYFGIKACLFLAVMLLAPSLLAQSHIVSSGDLQKQAVAASQSREQNVETIQQFLSSPTAEKALKPAHIDSAQVKSAVAGLNDQELQQLAARSRKAQADFAAGTLSDRDLLVILLAIVALVLIIVAVR